MAIDRTTLGNLYRKYLGRDVSDSDISTLTKQGFNTPSAVESLLSNTSRSIKGQTIKTIDQNISSLQPNAAQTGQKAFSLYFGQLPDYSTFVSQNPQIQEAQAGYDQALGAYDKVSQQATAAPERSRAQLKAGSVYLGESAADLDKKFGDPNSPWFIPDPNSRQQVVQQAVDQRNQTLQDVVTKIQGVYDTLTTAAQNQLAGQSEKLQGIMKMVEKSYEGLMSYYGERQAEKFQREQSQIIHGAGSGSSGSGDSSKTAQGYSAKRQWNEKTKKYEGTTFLHNGQPVTPLEYSQATGQRLDQVLVGNGNTGDQRLVSLIQEALKSGQPYESILQDMMDSGKYNWVFGLAS